MSRLPNFLPFCAVVQIFLCLNCRLLVKYKNSCRDCASAVTCLIWLDDFHIGLILCQVHSREMVSRVSVSWKRRVLEILVEEVSSRPAVDPNWQCHSATCVPLKFRAESVLHRNLGKRKSWRYELVKTNWSSESVISLYDMCSPEMASRAMC